MKRRIIFLLVFMFAVPILFLGVDAENSQKVVDNAGLLTSAEEEVLSDRIQKIVTDYSVDAPIVTVLSTGSRTGTQYADDYFDYGDYGVGDGKDGILLLLSMDERGYYISTHGYGIKVFTDYKLSRIGEEISGSLSKGSYYVAFSTYLDSIENYLSQAKNKTSYSSIDGIVPLGLNPITFSIIFVVSFLISLLIVMVMRRKMRTARKRRTAVGYIKKDSLKITKQRDIFLHSSVSATRREVSSGSSTHTSSSGETHGGSSGRF